ncbi:MAG: 23S rRNA (adenine(2503)-C2)-methyltransferase, partial [Gemmatimonadaceae bacterium]|nr:23S rRNA (adenine(2503)-C2)-methyltransferase [Gemmatimonadaceae bacterium]
MSLHTLPPDSPFPLYGVTRDQLRSQLTTWGVSAVHARPIWNALYLQLVTSIDAMDTLPAKVLARLRTDATLDTLPTALAT